MHYHLVAYGVTIQRQTEAALKKRRDEGWGEVTCIFIWNDLQDNLSEN